jgi:hypothetical protein
MLQAPMELPYLNADPGIVFADLRSKWTAVALSTKPAERKAAEAGLNKIYMAAELSAPRRIVWCGSPLAQGLVRAIVCDPEFLKTVLKCVWEHAANPQRTAFKDSVFDSFRASVRLFDVASVKKNLMVSIKAGVIARMQQRITDCMSENISVTVSASVWQGVWESVWESVWDNLWDGIDKGIRATIETSKKTLLEEAVLGSLGDCIGDPVKEKVWDGAMDGAWANIRNGAATKVRLHAWDELWGRLQVEIWEKVAMPIADCIKACGNDSAQASGYGQHDAYWLAFYDYFADIEGLGLVKETERVSGLFDVAKAAGWFAPHARICWVSERPRVLALNDAGRLHAADGPALEYPDGWRLDAVNGTLRFGSAK